VEIALCVAKNPTFDKNCNYQPPDGWVWARRKDVEEAMGHARPGDKSSSAHTSTSRSNGVYHSHKQATVDQSDRQRRHLGAKTPTKAAYRDTLWYARQGGWGADESKCHHTDYKSHCKSHQSYTFFPPEGTSKCSAFCCAWCPDIGHHHHAGKDRRAFFFQDSWSRLGEKTALGGAGGYIDASEPEGTIAPCRPAHLPFKYFAGLVLMRQRSKLKAQVEAESRGVGAEPADQGSIWKNAQADSELKRVRVAPQRP
jgi:hypothetical protein